MYTEKNVISSETVLIRIDNEIIYWRRNNPCTVKGGLLVDFCVIIFLIKFEFFSDFVF